MKRFILSAFSVLLATAAIAPTAQALPKVDSAFNLQTLRLRELDIRNKSDEDAQPYYSQPSSPQRVTAEQERIQTTKPTSAPTVQETPENQAETASPALTITEQRRQVLDRS